MKKFIAILLCFALLFTYSPLVKATSLSTGKTELLSERTAYGKTYRLADGTFQYVGHTKPIHYKDSSGAYVEINNAITDAIKQAGYKYTNTANQWNAHFSEKLNDSNAVMLTSGQYSISLSLAEQTSIGGVVKASALSVSRNTLSAYHQKLSADNRAVLYQDVVENVDVAYTVQTDALKEDIILKSKSAPSVYKFCLATNGLTIREADGKISLYTVTGKKVFSFAPLYMEDANGKRSEKVSLTYTSVKNGYELTVSADTEFLNAKDTAYPVVIDPSVYIVSDVSLEDTFVDQEYPYFNNDGAEFLMTGGSSGSYAKRTYFQFYYPVHIRPFQITSAYLYISQSDYEAPNIRAYAVTEYWSCDSLTWSNQPSHSDTIYSSLAQNTMRYETSNWYQMDITQILKDWLDFTLDDCGLVLKEVDESNSNRQTSYYSSHALSPNYPELEINYNPYYGSRPFQDIDYAYANCMGYALEYDEDVTEPRLNIDETQIYGENIWGVGSYYREKFDDWMYYHLGADNSAYIATYYSGINENWFRVCYVVCFKDKNDNSICDDKSESPGYHWYYQTNTGHWAEKIGSGLISKCHTELAAGTDPLTIWENGQTDSTESDGEVIYTYGFYQVRDIRNISWSY